MTASSIGQIILFYIIALPFYLALAAYSMRYYAKKSSNSAEEIKSFLASLRFPLNLFFNLNRYYTFARLETINPELYFFNTDLRELFISRMLCLLVSAAFILALLISHLIYRVPIDTINFLALILHISTFFWAFRFGSQLT